MSNAAAFAIGAGFIILLGIAVYRIKYAKKSGGGSGKSGGTGSQAEK